MIDTVNKLYWMGYIHALEDCGDKRSEIIRLLFISNKVTQNKIDRIGKILA